MHYTKRVAVDLSASIADAMREWRSSFAVQSRQRSKEAYVVRVWKATAPANTDRSEWLTLSHSFFEQGVEPTDVLLLYPVSGLRTMTVKGALTAALFTGWLMKSAIKVQSGAMSLRKPSTLRQSSKKPYFFVLRNSCLLSFKSDVRGEKLHKVILLDYYRFAKVSMEGKGFALRLDQKDTGALRIRAAVFALYICVCVCVCLGCGDDCCADDCVGRLRADGAGGAAAHAAGERH